MGFWERWYVRMNSIEVYLGIDTSCYTTSVAVVDRQGVLIAEARQLLLVKSGKRGLAQSEMVFQHTRNLPVLIEDIFSRNDMNIIGIGVSKKPRPVEDSYMPAFLTGYGLANSLAKILQVDLAELSHQENHLEAALWSSGFSEFDKCLMLHASGGTTEIILVTKTTDDRYILQEVGGSLDLHAGQYVDRVGVAMGLSFPAGPHLEQLAQIATGFYELPVAVKDEYVSFSGPCTAALRALENGAAQDEIALGVEVSLAESLFSVLEYLSHKEKCKNILLAGGVMSNQYISGFLQQKLAKQGLRVWSAKPKFSSDNAVGCAIAAKRLLGV